VRDLSKPDHLPNLREGRQPPEPSWLPCQRRGITPQMIGRYPDYDVFEAAETWDPATARVIAERMEVRGTFARCATWPWPRMPSRASQCPS
jgi:hypothetical protein